MGVVFSAFSLASFFSSFFSAPLPAFASHSATQSFFLAPFFSSFVMSRHCVSQDLVLVSCAETGAVKATAELRNATEHKPTIKRLFIAASLMAHRKSLGRGAQLRPGQSSSCGNSALE